MLDDSGFSKGFGFIRFGNEQEQQTAMTSMMGVSGLGGKPIKVGEIKFDTYLTRALSKNVLVRCPLLFRKPRWKTIPWISQHTWCSM